MIKYVGFDKDGTLFDSITAYAKASGEVFHLWHPEISVEEGTQFFIDTSGQESALQVDTIFRKHGIILTKEEVFKKSNEWAEKLANETTAMLFPDVKDSLIKLKKSGFKLFVSSFQMEDVVRKDLDESGIIKYFDFYAGVRADDPSFVKGQPHFEAAAEKFSVPFSEFIKDTVYVGDTITDIGAAKSVGIKCIIRTNKSKIENFKSLSADFVVEDFNNLGDLIKNI